MNGNTSCAASRARGHSDSSPIFFGGKITHGLGAKPTAQTRDNVRQWLAALGLSEKVGLHILMGGEDSGEWDIHPEREAILIGTQDMLLSRALNRGYGMSRYRWPMHFALLNNDALWVMDETQLMGVGVETGAQLAGFRERFGSTAPCPVWWMSATLDAARLATPEAPQGPTRSG